MESNYWNQKSDGVWIPNSYFEVRDILSTEDGNVLLLPAVNTYIMTSWNYFGTSSFYNEFLYSSDIIDLNNMDKGIYSSFNGSLMQNYLNLTSPIGPSFNNSIPMIGNNSNSSLTPLSLEYTNYGVWGANATRNFYGLDINSTYSSYVHIGFDLNNSIDLQSYTYAKVSFNISNQTFFNSAIKSGSVSIGLGSTAGIIAWWNLKTLIYQTRNNTEFSFYVPLYQGFSGSYERNAVNQIWINFDYGSKINFPPMNVSYPLVYGVPMEINNSWLNLMQYNGIRFILVDNSIINGLISSYNYTDVSMEILMKMGFVKLIYNSETILLYEIVKFNGDCND